MQNPAFVCSITHLLMQNPMITSRGHSYEGSAIRQWFKTKQTDPITGLPCSATLFPNHALRGLIQAAHPDLVCVPAEEPESDSDSVSQAFQLNLHQEWVLCLNHIRNRVPNPTPVSWSSFGMDFTGVHEPDVHRLQETPLVDRIRVARNLTDILQQEELARRMEAHLELVARMANREQHLVHRRRLERHNRNEAKRARVRD